VAYRWEIDAKARKEHAQGQRRGGRMGVGVQDDVRTRLRRGDPTAPGERGGQKEEVKNHIEHT